MLIAFLVNFLVFILILGLIYTVCMWAIGVAGLPAPASRVLQIFLAIVVLIYLLDFFGSAIPHGLFLRW